MKYEKLKAKLDEKGEAYKASDSVTEREKLTTEIRDLQVQLQDSLADGATACPDGADHRVIGMLKTPAHYDNITGMDVPDLYEVGCVVCPPVLVPFDETKHRAGVDHPSDTDKKGAARKVVRWSHSARDFSPEEAVKNWNDGKWIIDTKTERVPTTTVFES
jgi:hypothetical protein